MVKKTTMRVLIAVLVLAVVSTAVVVSVVARQRHQPEEGNDVAGAAATEERRSRRRSHKRQRDPREEAFIAHMRRVTEFRCRHPAPIAVDVLALQSEMSWRPATYEEFEPQKTILHRCGHASGCCQNHMHSCQEVELKEVSLVFNVLDTRTGKMRYEEVTLANHTRCECLENLFHPK